MLVNLAMVAALAIPAVPQTLPQVASPLPQMVRTVPFSVEERLAQEEIIDMCRKLEDVEVARYMKYPTISIEKIYADYRERYVKPLVELEGLVAELQTMKDYVREEDTTLLLLESYSTDSASLVQESVEIASEALSSAKQKLQEEKEAEEAARKAEAAAKATAVGNSSGLTKAGGVNYYNGRKETYYSSRVLYHYRTSEWLLDSEGFYRTSEGYFVVAASDLPQGTLVEGSKGTCIVLDSGCAANVLDYYVSW